MNLRNFISETAQNDIKPEKILGVLWDEIDDTFIFDFKEIVELSETLLATTKGEHLTVQIGDVVVMEEGNMPRSSWRLGKVEGLIKGHDNQVRGAHKKVAKKNAVVQRPVSRLYKAEGKEDNANSDMLNKDNVNKDSDRNENTSNIPKREVAIIGELKHKYRSDVK